MGYKMIIFFGGKYLFRKNEFEKILISCQHLEFCHTKSDSTYPLYILTLWE